MNIKSLIKSLVYIVACSVTGSAISIILVSFLAQSSEIQQLTQNFEQVANALPIPAIDEFLARSYILLEYHPLRFLSTAGVWWVAGGLLLGIILGHFRKGSGLLMISGILEPILVGLVTGYFMNLAIPDYVINSALELASKNIPGGLIAGIGGLIGAALGSSIYPVKIKIPEELFQYDIEPLIQMCPKCNTELFSNASYCDACGMLLNSESPIISSEQQLKT